jgi:CBS domain containing-hemolysin-like protein
VSTLLLIVLLLLFLLSLAVFSGAETAFFSLSSMQIKAFKKDRDPKKRLISFLLSNPRELLVTFIILIVVMSLAIQNTVSALFSRQESWLLNIGIPLTINLVVGEMIPKSLALPNNVRIAYRFAALLFWMQKILFPVRKLLSFLAGFVVPVLFFFLRKEKEISIDELQHALKTSREQGILHPEEAELIRGYLYLQESTVKELMRPREEVIFFEKEDPLSRLIHLFVDLECTRIPLCEGGLDKILGIISSRLFFLHRNTVAETKDLVPIVKKPYFVPETTKADVLLKQFYEKKETFAIVVDEYGSISGIISLEDLVEEVIGDIADRRDQKASYTRSEGGVIITSGKFELSEFEEIFDISLKSENNMVTIGGWLTEQLGDIPKPGTKYQAQGFLFHVLAADPTRVRRIYIRQQTPAAFKSKKSK